MQELKATCLVLLYLLGLFNKIKNYCSPNNGATLLVAIFASTNPAIKLVANQIKKDTGPASINNKPPKSNPTRTVATIV